MFYLDKIPVFFCVPHLHSSSPCGMILWIETSQLWIHRAQPAALWPSSASCGHMLRHRARVREPRNRGPRHPVAPKKGSHRTRNLEVFFGDVSDLRWYFFCGWCDIWDDTTIKEEWVLISKFSKNHPKPHLIFRKRFYLAKKPAGRRAFSDLTDLEILSRNRLRGEHEASLQILQSLHGKRIGIPRKSPRDLGPNHWKTSVGNQTFLTKRVLFCVFFCLKDLWRRSDVQDVFILKHKT